MRALSRDDSGQYVSKTVIEVYPKTGVVLKTVVKENYSSEQIFQQYS